MNPDKEFLEYVVKGVVEFPEAVHIDRRVDEMGVLLSLTVHRDDMGKIIGKEGAVAKAIRTVLRSVGMKNGQKVNLKILEPQEQNGGRPLAASVRGADEMKEAMEAVKGD